MAENSSLEAKTVVLVHGGFVDGSGWEGVYKILRKDGYNVAIVQNPTISLADDVAATRRTIADQNGPVVLVGHSYGGVVITEAGKFPVSLRILRLARPCHRSCHRRMAISSSTDQSSLPRSRLMWSPKKLRSWPIHKFPGVLTHWAVRSVSLEKQAELVPGHHRRQDDSACGPASHVSACGFHSG